MLMIRLARGGSKHRPFYHIRAADKRNPRDGAYSEQLGYFNPLARGQEKRLVIDVERIEALIKQGAQVSDRVTRLMRDDKLGEQETATRKEKKNARLTKRRAEKKAAKAQQATEEPASASEK